MSDDDLIRRGDVFRVIHGVAEFKRDVVDAYIDNIPAVPPSPAAERLARAAVRREAASAALAFENPETQVEWNDALAEFREAMEAYRAAPPAAEPAIFQKPGSSCDEGAVRGNNPEPAAEPAPTTYSHDEVAAILRNFGIDVSCGACAAIAFTGTAPGLSHECGKETPELVVTEPAKEPAPCGTCGGSGQVFDSPRVGPFDTKSACPECSPGGAA